MRPRDRGAIVQVGSALAYRGIPLQSAYCGAKHAIQGFTRVAALRTAARRQRRARDDGADAGRQHTAVLLGAFQAAAPRRSPYRRSTSPNSRPAAIVRAADKPQRREYWVGSSTVATLIANAIAPGVLDRYLARTGFASQQTDQRRDPDAPANLWEPADGRSARLRGPRRFDDRAHGRDPQPWASQHHGCSPPPRPRWPGSLRAAARGDGDARPAPSRVLAARGCLGATRCWPRRRAGVLAGAEPRRSGTPPDASACSVRATSRRAPWTRRPGRGHADGRRSTRCTPPACSAAGVARAAAGALIAARRRLRPLGAGRGDGHRRHRRRRNRPRSCPRTSCASTRCSPTGSAAPCSGPRGDIVWLCAPRWDDDAVFSALVGGPGAYAVTPRDAASGAGTTSPAPDLAQPVGHRRHRIMECREALALPGRRAPRGPAAPDRGRSTAPRTRRRRPARRAPGSARTAMSDLHRDDDGAWTARAGDLRLRWPAPPAAAVDRDGDGSLRRLVVADGQRHDLVLEISDRRCRPPARPGPGVGARPRRAWRDAVPQLEHRARAPRRPPRLRRAARADQRRRRHGRRRHDEPARAGRGRPQLRLPLRLDPRPVLRGHGGRRATARTRCCTTPSASWPSGCSADGDRTHARLHRRRRAGPDERRLDLPGYPGGTDVAATGSNDQFQLDALGEALQLFAAAARHDASDTRAPGEAAAAAVDAIDEALARARRRDLGAGRRAGGRIAAGLRRRARRAGAVRAAAPTAGALRRRSADAILAETTADCLHPRGHWQRSPERPTASTRRCCCRRSAARCRPTTRARSRPWTLCDATWSTTATSTGYRHDGRPSAGRGRVPAVRFPHRPRRAPAGRRGQALRAGSSATEPPAARPGCSRRSSTSSSDSCAATFRRHSFTPCCSRRPSAWRSPTNVRGR